MVHEIVVEYWNPVLKIGMNSWDEVYILINNTPVKMIPMWNNGTISYRIRGKSSKIGLITIKKNIKKEKTVIQEYIPF